MANSTVYFRYPDITKSLKIYSLFDVDVSRMILMKSDIFGEYN